MYVYFWISQLLFNDVLDVKYHQLVNDIILYEKHDRSLLVVSSVTIAFLLFLKYLNLIPYLRYRNILE